MKKATTKKLEKKEVKLVKQPEEQDYQIIQYVLRQFYQVQEHRIAFAGQIRAMLEADKDPGKLKDYYVQLHTLEKDMTAHVASVIELHPLWGEFLDGVKGIGPLLAGSLISYIDIKKAEHVSSIWKFVGLAVDENGEADRLKRGEKCSFSPYMKTVCWKIAQSFIKVGGPYREVYDKAKEHYQKKYPEPVKIEGTKRTKYTKGHIHKMAMRIMVKEFLKDVWLNWRRIEGLSISDPYEPKTAR